MGATDHNVAYNASEHSNLPVNRAAFVERTRDDSHLISAFSLSGINKVG